jgi:hypothetical protein
MEVPAVDQRYGELFATEGSRGVEPAESAADDDGPMHLFLY